jgi:uncharacterized protein
MTSETSRETDSLIEFPCDFPLKIMGPRHDRFAQTVVDIVLRHAPDFDPAAIEMRASSKGKYLSLTCTIRAVSRAQLDALYVELSGHDMVTMVL